MSPHSPRGAQLRQSEAAKGRADDGAAGLAEPSMIVADTETAGDTGEPRPDIPAGVAADLVVNSDSGPLIPVNG